MELYAGIAILGTVTLLVSVGWIVVRDGHYEELKEEFCKPEENHNI